MEYSFRLLSLPGCFCVILPEILNIVIVYDFTFMFSTKHTNCLVHDVVRLVRMSNSLT